MGPGMRAEFVGSTDAFGRASSDSSSPLARPREPDAGRAGAALFMRSRSARQTDGAGARHTRDRV